MKKIILVVLSFLLAGCQSHVMTDTKTLVEEEADWKIKEEVPYLSRDEVKSLAMALNQELIVIDIEKHHKNLEGVWRSVLDFERPLEDQRDLVEQELLTYLQAWRLEAFRQLLWDWDMSLNPEDWEAVLKKTSILSIYSVLLSYEMIQLEKEYD